MFFHACNNHLLCIEAILIESEKLTFKQDRVEFSTSNYKSLKKFHKKVVLISHYSLKSISNSAKMEIFELILLSFKEYCCLFCHI